MKETRLRFAPSPTGYLHIGGLRTALFNYLYAKKHDGSFILRIEDTDRTRYVEGAIENLIEQMNWLGVNPDEGVLLEDGKLIERGEYGPYIQSERVEEGIYKPYIEELLQKGYAYHCFCSQERIDQVKAQKKADGLMPKYDGLCRGVSLEEARKRVANGEEYVIRLKLPENRDIVFEDAIKGKITINTNDMDDQVLIKSDGFPTYHFAVVVDDHLMKITHIVRGDEWVSSTPKHVFLYEAFGWEMPKFIHLPTVLNKSGKKLSKRFDDVSVKDFRKKGYLPDGMLNYLALIGWSPDDNEEIISRETLIQKFDFDRISKSGGVFDTDKFDWVNAHYIKALSDEELTKLIKPYLVEVGFITESFVDEKLLFVARTFKDGMHKLSDIVEQSRFIFEDLPFEEDARELVETDGARELAKAFIEELGAVEEVDEEFSNTIMKKIQKKTGIKGKNLFMPTRAMISGNLHGPEMTDIIQLLGKEKLMNRLNRFEG